MIYKHILLIDIVKRSNSSISNNSICHESKLNGSKYYYVSLRIQLNIRGIIYSKLKLWC